MQSKRWCFTLNNYTDHDESIFANANYKYCVYGREKGESGTPHLQGFITFGKAMRLAGVRKLHGRAHWEIAKGTSKQAADYCKKDGDFIEYGEVPSQGKRNDLSEAIAVLKSNGLKASAEAHPEVFVKYSRGLRDLSLMLGSPYNHDEVRGLWIWGPPGSGKSHWCRAQFPSLFIKAQNKWFDGYDKEEVILLDDLDTNVLGHYLKIWADKYSCTGETKGGTVHLQHHVFAVTSNYSIDQLFDDDVMAKAITRRFYIVHKDTIDTPINFT